MRSGLVRFHDGLEGLMVPITDLSPHPLNPNNGDVEAIIISITENGYYPAPIVAHKDTKEIVVGNHRYAALMEMGSEVAPVLWVDTDTVEAIRIMLVDNRSSDLRRYDLGQQRQVLEILERAGKLAGSGYSQDYLDKLRAGDQRASEAVADANAKKEPVFLEGKSLLFLEITEEDRARFYEFTTEPDDSSRFHEMLDYVEAYRAERDD